jgi:hypothetical protein
MIGPGKTWPTLFFDMDRPPITLYLLTIIGLALSGWLVLYGLQMRFFGAVISLNGILAFLTPPHRFVQLFTQIFSGVRVDELGWPLVVIGCSITGALTGLWKRQSWASPSLMFFSIVSIITFHWLNILSILIIALSRSPGLQEWLTSKNAIQG